MTDSSCEESSMCEKEKEIKAKLKKIRKNAFLFTQQFISFQCYEDQLAEALQPPPSA